MVMGDAADADFDSGFDAWTAHLRGECDAWCPYCNDEDGENEDEEREL